MDIINKLTGTGYVATPAQVATLALLITSGQRADGTYLRVLIATTQARIANHGKGRKPAPVKVLDKVHGEFYPAVLKAVEGDSARAVFARTAVSTVRSYLRSGGSLTGLDPATVSKSGLRRAVAPAEAGDRKERAFVRATGALERAAVKIATKDPAGARRRLQAALDRLQTVLDGLPSVAARSAPRLRSVPGHAGGRSVGNGAPAH